MTTKWCASVVETISVGANGGPQARVQCGRGHRGSGQAAAAAGAAAAGAAAAAQLPVAQ